MSAKTPTEDEMVRAYVEKLGPITLATEFRRQEEARRAIAAIRAAAWDEAIDACAEQGTIQTPINPYRKERA